MLGINGNRSTYPTSGTTTQQTDKAQDKVALATEYRTKLTEWVERAPAAEYALRSEARDIAEKAHQSYLNGEHLGTGILEGSSRWVDLNLSEWGLTECPPLFEGLERLDINSTEITALPENLPSSLSKLIANKSKLEKLPEDIATTCPKLDYFQLEKTKLTELPTLPTIRGLYIKETNIKQLPEGFKAYGALAHTDEFGRTTVHGHGSTISVPW